MMSSRSDARVPRENPKGPYGKAHTLSFSAKGIRITLAVILNEY